MAAWRWLEKLSMPRAQYGTAPPPVYAAARMASYRLDEQIGFLLRKAHQRHRSIFSQGIGVKLAPTQFAVLARLRDDGPTSQNELGRRTAMDSATTAGVIDRLVRRRLLAITTSPHDDRLSIVDLTAAGRALIDELIPRAAQISAATVAGLSAAEVTTLLGLLGRIADAEGEAS